MFRVCLEVRSKFSLSMTSLVPIRFGTPRKSDEILSVNVCEVDRFVCVEGQFLKN